MKVSKEKTKEIANLIEKYLAARYPDVLKDIKQRGDFSSEREMWVIWQHIVCEHHEPDDSPRFKDRKRVFSFNWGFEMYPENTNDKTLTTALRAAIHIVATK